MSRRSVVLDTHHLATTDYIILKLPHKPHVQYFFLKKKEEKKEREKDPRGYERADRLPTSFPLNPHPSPAVDCSKWAP